MPIQTEGHVGKVVSCEDLILLKLHADRLIDRMDVRYLLENNRASLDFAYLTNWIGKLQLQKEWAEWWDQAFPGELAPAVTPPAAPGMT